MECPGDINVYNCSIQSNSESVQLTWRVTFPGEEPVSLEYNSTSLLNSLDNISMNITSRLTNFVESQYIESVLFVTLPQNISLNQTVVECFSADLDKNSIVIVTDSSGK